MFTRGVYLGEVIDEFAAISSQVKMRNRLGLTDMSILCENFFKDVLNCLLGAELENLNKERSNEPGLDLGDKKRKLAIQVTSTASSHKLNHTLSRISEGQQNSYKKFVVLTIGDKQKSYSLTEELKEKFKFNHREHVWDLNTLARKAINLEIDALESLHRVVRANAVRVKIDLEIPDENGVYPTNCYELWEKRMEPKVGDGSAFSQFIESLDDDELTEEDRVLIAKGVRDLGKRLSRLPRITREFLVVLLERRDIGKSKRFNSGWSHILYDKVIREFRGREPDDEIAILSHAGFVSVESEDRYELGPAEIGIRISDVSDELANRFLRFVKEKDLSLRRVLGDGDLSAF